MNLPAALYALRWLVLDTFRQSMSGKVFWIMSGVSTLAIVFCLGISVKGGVVYDEGQYYHVESGRDFVGGADGTMTLLFGMIPVKMHRGGVEEVRFIQVFLAVWFAGAAGLIMTLVWTAGMLPDFLQPSSAVVLLSKPTPRWMILLGKYLGVVLFVALQAMFFFVGTWAALGVRTGVWNNTYLLGWPMLTLQFAVFYGVSVLIASAWRSQAACMLGVLLFWIASFGINYGRYAAIAMPALAETETRTVSPITAGLAEMGYWIFPKPVDYIVMLEDLLQADKEKATLGTMPEFQFARERGQFQPFLSLLTSVGFAVVMIGLAGKQLADAEY
jgi:ABC-type transport system involved in multi-copper enzyme maturation permease subunit